MSCTKLPNGRSVTLHQHLITAIFCTVFCVTGIGHTWAEEIRASLNTPFDITLKANPTTGYQWKADFDKNFLTLKSRTYTRDASKPKEMVGVGGHTKYTFVPVKTGETTVKLVYRRTWEKNKPADEKIFNIVVSR